MTKEKYIVLADRAGKLWVATADTTLTESEVRLTRPFATSDEAFDWLEHQQSLIDAAAADPRHRVISAG